MATTYRLLLSQISVSMTADIWTDTDENRLDEIADEIQVIIDAAAQTIRDRFPVSVATSVS